MAPSISDPVTIERAYFETLLRSAMPSAGTDETFVPVPKEEYRKLLLLSRQFANLKTSLIGAGVTEENLATLVQDATSYNQGTSLGARAKQTKTTNPVSAFEATPYTTHDHVPNGTLGRISYFNSSSKSCAFEENHEWTSHEQIGGHFTPSCSADGPTDVHTDSLHQIPQPLYARMCKRTVTLCGLPAFTTIGDVTGVVRGGRLLDVFLRSAEHIASVSFVREDDAVQFYEHGRRNDIYIRNKRVFIRWADRHFILPGHVANKIASGATRNLIIRRCGAHHTEDSVREDLEHIHNLIVVGVEFVGGSCYIKTNSVHNAMFARTCMMSRARYKGSKIEWDVDECDKPFEITQKTSTKPLPRRSPSTNAPVTSTRNRFAMLRLDDDDNHESDDKFDTSSEIPSTVDVAA
ncbi:hypothetical protein F4680DRAFT_471227 [Xylaria scruposa]|nr:hypothetical protein F4680DRAFT_471227 [Xylaria scruposa]